jgi:hypothetical protein
MIVEGARLGGGHPTGPNPDQQNLKMNDIDPQAWLADVLARIAEHPAHRIDELLPWNWRGAGDVMGRAA